QVGDSAARAQGTGLGLSICHRIVAQMGGSLTATSQVGQGSVFEVTLRLERGTTALAAEPESVDGDIVGYTGERRQILVVDDIEDNRGVLRDLLSPLGFEVAEAASGEEALHRAIASPPDLVVMDLAMQGMDGYEATRRFLRLPELREAVVIASSASVVQGE